MKKFKGKVIVGLSGGVDSSVAAALLKKQGYEVAGVFMKNWTGRQDEGCTWAEDAQEARAAAAVLGIPFFVWNFEKEYRARVVEYFLREYKLGRTPNPDVMCNREIKFKAFLDKALSLGADLVATGHYARIRETQNLKLKTQNYQLLKGVDPGKDQSYFLYTLTQKELARILFPVGKYKKSKVRQLARKFRLPNSERKDSQGICFIGKIDVTKFLKKYIKGKTGEIVDVSGRILGEHFGLPFYTIGQREGLGLGGTGPYYVVAKNFRANRLVVSNNPKDRRLWRKKFVVSEVTWVGKKPALPMKTGCVIRYHHPAYLAKIQHISRNTYHVTFQKPQRAITPGQAAVFYRGAELLGGGAISEVK